MSIRLSVLRSLLAVIEADEREILTEWEQTNLDGRRVGTMDWPGWKAVAERCGLVPSKQWPWWERAQPSPKGAGPGSEQHTEVKQ